MKVIFSKVIELLINNIDISIKKRVLKEDTFKGLNYNRQIPCFWKYFHHNGDLLQPFQYNE
jgi:hypothetical protein